MYGHTFMLGYEGDPEPTLILKGSTNELYLDGGNGNIFSSGNLFAHTFQPYEALWEGPTNTVDTSASDYYYVASSDCKITGMSPYIIDATHGWSGLLTITNSRSTNILLRFPSSIVIPERTNAVVISNASQGMISLKWSHRSGTNGVYRQF